MALNDAVLESGGVAGLDVDVAMLTDDAVTCV